ncbi:aspartyl-phosphate phosphatase Spo0E family protein [Bacillus sp. DNRA2]|uniref:aspartyl-phosphate phosphatase Spo0E family protein n=1 Tax=Bacillus sp. DNRA2 TaxID=2723053 RepID=UPI00145F8A13|nr:aspartyl-phosphate phosphatase Spo0E family protein [Bacillus sp. DNRA2]NMD69984.1 aspartyl-phosphate phosphatase Spo0E family protein [Bacillus sp. DNRA2]
MLKIDNNLELLCTIESLRREMICVGLKEGLSSEKTIEISQKLDQYIANYQANCLLIESSRKYYFSS